MQPQKIAGEYRTDRLVSPSGDKLIHLTLRVQFLEVAKTVLCINVSIQVEYGLLTMGGIQQTLIKIDTP